jgi:hypothetical protein
MTTFKPLKIQPVSRPSRGFEPIVDDRTERDAYYRQMSRLKECLALAADTHRALAAERNRYLSLLNKVAAQGGDYCSECSGTGRNVAGISLDLDHEGIRNLMNDRWDDFDAEFPDDCDNEFCFNGFEIDVS